jgi:hypothetical protein
MNERKMKFVLTYFPIFDPFEKRLRMGVTFFKNRRVTIFVCRDCSPTELWELFIEEFSHGFLCLFLSAFYKDCKNDKIARIIDFSHKILYPIFNPRKRLKKKLKLENVIIPSFDSNGSYVTYEAMPYDIFKKGIRRLRFLGSSLSFRF